MAQNKKTKPSLPQTKSGKAGAAAASGPNVGAADQAPAGAAEGTSLVEALQQTKPKMPAPAKPARGTAPPPLPASNTSAPQIPPAGMQSASNVPMPPAGSANPPNARTRALPTAAPQAQSSKPRARTPIPMSTNLPHGNMGPKGPPTPIALGMPHASANPEEQARRAAKRRAAATPRPSIAANDDAPTIGGLIYAMEQKPSQRPFIGAAVASGIWMLLGTLFGWAMLSPQFPKTNGLIDLLSTPAAMTVMATLLIPIAMFWAVAMLIWRSQEMKLMSSAMTEVAVRLAEPDRMAEQSVASLGQSVRRQVSFMNDAVERALGRAGELEALVHAEVSSLEQSYSDNEMRIRGLIDELSGERHALQNSSSQIVGTLKDLGSEVPALIEKLNSQQGKLAHIIEGAGQNLTALESAIDSSAANLENKLGARTETLQLVMRDYTNALDTVMSSRSDQMAASFTQYVESLDSSIGSRTDNLQIIFEEYARALDTTLTSRAKVIDSNVTHHTKAITSQLNEQANAIDSSLSTRTEALASVISGHSENLNTTLSDHAQTLDKTMAGYTNALSTSLSGHAQTLDNTMSGYSNALNTSLSGHTQALNSSLSGHTKTLDTIMSERSHALHSNLEHHVLALDSKLVDRTQALNDAFSERLTLFDDSIRRSTAAFEGAVGEKAQAITEAIELQARDLSQTLGRQAGQIDETLMHGINSVRRTSESITKESLKAIEGLANQSDVLKNVSDNMLQQIGGVTTRFEQQGQSIMKAANQLDRANSRIDLTLQQSNKELGRTLDDVYKKTELLDNVLSEHTTSLESTMSEAQLRAKQLTQELSQNAQSHAQSVLSDIERVKLEADTHTKQAIEDMRGKVTDTSRMVNDQMSSMASKVSDTSEEVRAQSARAAAAIEQERLRMQNEYSTTTQEIRQNLKTLSTEFVDTNEEIKRQTEMATIQLEEEQRRLREQFSNVTRDVDQGMSNLSNQVSNTAAGIRQQAEQSSAALAQEQEKLRQQMNALPEEARKTTETVRSSLQDQMRALEQLSSLSNKQAQRNDIAEPVGTGAQQDSAIATRPSASAQHPSLTARLAQPGGSTPPLDQGPVLSPQATTIAASQPQSQTQSPAPSRVSLTEKLAERSATVTASQNPSHAASDQTRALNSIGNALAETRAQRTATGGQPDTGFPKVVKSAAASKANNRPDTAATDTDALGSTSSGWSVGDLLARASEDDSAPSTPGASEPSAPNPAAQLADSNPVSQPGGSAAQQAAPSSQSQTAQPQPAQAQEAVIDIHLIAKALEPVTAAALWDRLRMGQRNVMVRSIYTPEGRATYDETLRAYQSNNAMQLTVDRYLTDFEIAMNNAEQARQDPAVIQQTLTSEAGRVYLFLAHISGRFS